MKDEVKSDWPMYVESLVSFFDFPSAFILHPSSLPSD